MPRPLKVCTTSGCPELTKGGKCDQHKKQSSKTRNAKYEFQHGSRWREFAKRFLRDYPQCFKCGEPAAVVDHIVSVDADPSRKFDRTNCQSLCRSCHGKKTASVDGGFGRYYADGRGHDG